ncbi:MAG: aminotransferase class III-fold pyridoxal phosphate-dependent enzyme [Betaproteobacteria bacterium]|nr:MAG: aminotransferase class III-fold pyridoxal phosphate-dependent enzyme [Betaproteobacteria bacterium]
MKLDHYWMPFTDNRRFKGRPRLVASAKGMYYTTVEGKQVLDGLATLWCVNAGHGHPRIVEAIRRQAGELDFGSSFGLGHPLPFVLAERIAALAPRGMEHVFFTNSGSEAIDTAMKIAVAYHRLRGEGTRTRFIGRERSYHGVNIGGTSLGGVAANRKAYSGILMPGIDHLRHTHDAKRRFVRGCAETGAELADELEERLIPLHDASNIAAVVVDPVAASGGVLVPPKGYLARLREICSRHGILLVFDEVITGWGRLGAPFAAQHFGVEPDLITFAKGITSGAVPLGGVIVRKAIYETFMHAQGAGMEFFHGYTYSGHPLACAAGLAALEAYAEEKLFDIPLAGRFEDGVHALKGLPHVVDCRNLGFIGAVELEPRPGAPGARAYETFEKCWERGVFVRPMGDALAFCPPLIAESKHLEQMFGTVAEVLKTLS